MHFVYSNASWTSLAWLSRSNGGTTGDGKHFRRDQCISIDDTEDERFRDDLSEIEGLEEFVNRSQVMTVDSMTKLFDQPRATQLRD